ncbi:hypothetical protein FKM82_018840 [Ascaphus truei]
MERQVIVRQAQSGARTQCSLKFSECSDILWRPLQWVWHMHQCQLSQDVIPVGTVRYPLAAIGNHPQKRQHSSFRLGFGESGNYLDSIWRKESLSWL